MQENMTKMPILGQLFHTLEPSRSPQGYKVRQNCLPLSDSEVTLAHVGFSFNLYRSLKVRVAKIMGLGGALGASQKEPDKTKERERKYDEETSMPRQNVEGEINFLIPCTFC